MILKNSSCNDVFALAEIDSCTWQLGWKFDTESVQCENFCILQCSHLVCSTNQNWNRNQNMAM